MELEYKVQNYQWGKKGINSAVYKLYANTNTVQKNDKYLHFAELWMGTHPNGPSKVKKMDGELLQNVLKKHPEYLGKETVMLYKSDLPFLFKVLSINTALSIQAHPDKDLASVLHTRNPNLYRDANHKPELAIALTPFEALCGFRPYPDIAQMIINVPELRTIVGEETAQQMDKGTMGAEDTIKRCLRTLLTTPEKVVHNLLKKLVLRLKASNSEDKQLYMFDLIAKLAQQYPGDVGCFMVYFLNYVKLAPSEAIFLSANVPHAYISGDCIECMANSDNVVRAGLTPKEKDVETLLMMLNYKGEPPRKHFLPAVAEDDCTKTYTPPVPEFAVAEIKIPFGMPDYLVNAKRSASIFIVIEGDAQLLDIHIIPGVSFFVPAKVALPIKTIKKDVLMFQAFVNV